MRRGGQVWKVRRVIVAKDDCSIGALVMIGIGLLEGIFLPDEEFPEMQERVVNEKYVDAQKPDFTPVFMLCLEVVDKRRAAQGFINRCEIISKWTTQRGRP